MTSPDEKTALHERAVELADEAPPLTADQKLLLVSLCARYREAVIST